MAFFIYPPVAIPGIYCVCFWRDCIRCVSACDIFPYRSSSISLISQNVCSLQFHMRENIDGINIIIYIPSGQLKVNRIPQTIYNCMEFCGVSSTAFSNVLAGIIIQSPFFAPVPC